LQRLAELKLPIGRVLQALESENANIPAGVVDIGPRSFSVKTTGAFANLDQVRDTVVNAADGRTLRIRDIAKVSWNEGQWGHIGRYDGKRAVFVTANMKEGYNILQVRKAIGAAVDRYAVSLPKRVALELGFDQSGNVKNRLDRLYFDFALAIALVLITLLPLGLSAATIVMISIPLSLAIGITALYFLGYSLNQLSIAGFVVALGLLVDDSIVVVENISRHLRMGYERTSAALAGTKQIFIAILGCTATLVFAFLPLMALPVPPVNSFASCPRPSYRPSSAR
jgi:multidrug efflux pump subunit AcrB